MKQINLPSIISFIKKNFAWIISVILVVIIYFTLNRTSNLEKQSEKHLQDAKESEIKAKFYKGLYDKLIEEDNDLEVKYDSLILEKNKIKIQYNEKIKIIDKYSVSDMQRYFDERTK